MGSLKSRQPEPLGGQTPPRLDVGTMDRDPSEEDSKYSGEGAGEGAGRPPLQPVRGRVLPLPAVPSQAQRLCCRQRPFLPPFRGRCKAHLHPAGCFFHCVPLGNGEGWQKTKVRTSLPNHGDTI